MIGRDGQCSFRIGSSQVSKRHAAIEIREHRAFVRDLGSTNGTLVNGRAVDGRGHSLRGGEKVVFGAVVLRYQP